MDAISKENSTVEADKKEYVEETVSDPKRLIALVEQTLNDRTLQQFSRIMGNASMLQQGMIEPDIMEEISKAANEGSQLVQHVRALSREFVLKNSIDLKVVRREVEGKNADFIYFKAEDSFNQPQET